MHGIARLVEEVLGSFVCVCVCWQVDQLVSRSVSVFPKYLNLRHISHTPLAIPSLHSLNKFSVSNKQFSCNKK